MSLLLSLLLLVALKPGVHGTVDVMDEEWIVYGGEATDPPTTTTPPPDSCDPSCDGATVEKPQVDDPKDCHKFYLCLGGEVNGPLDCPDGEYFNTTNKVCQPNEAEECEPICPDGGGGGGGGGDGKCCYSCLAFSRSGFKAFNTTYKIADHYDCSYYYDCTDENTPIPCEEPTPFFNGEKCQQDESKCCHCKPFCYEGDVNKKVIDPLDCTKYYFCLEENMVPEFSGTCPIGNFDPLHQECSMTVPCITMCTNVVNGEGCIDVYTCQEVGYFSACPNRCGPEYYHCSADDVGHRITATTCTDGHVFYQDNTQCVPPTDCPYPPPGF